MISHVSFGTNDLDRARAFYDKVLATLGYKRVMTFEVAVAYGEEYPDFWIGFPHDDSRVAEVGNGVHVAFTAKRREDVDAFHAAAIAAGATDDGPPGPRPLYGESYYGAFVRDPDGNKIEAVQFAPAAPGYQPVDEVRRV